MNKKRLLTAGLLVASFCFSACSKKEPALGEPVIRPVRTMTVTLQNAINIREFSGVVDADRKVDLAFRVSGTVNELPVLEGDFVAPNQVLAKLDQKDFDIQLKATQADFDRSKGEYERAKTLLDRELLSRSDFERVEAQYFIAEAQLDKAKQDLAYSSISAPFEGFIAKRYVENFSEVAARAPVLTLMDLNSLVVKIEVPESVMIQAQREGERPELYATFEGYEATQFPLTIKEIATQPNTQTYPVTLSLPPISNLTILPGMSALVGVRPFARADGLSDIAYLPAQAVLEDSRGHYVFVAIPGEEDRATVERREVEVGDISSFGIQVLSGLETGDEVITAGMSQVTTGMQVLLMAK